MEDTRLGTILLESRVVPEEDLQHCLEIQALTGGTRPLGQILVEEGVISTRTLNALLSIQEARRSKHRTEMPVEGSEPDRFLRAAVSSGATELHLSEGRPALVRVAGQLQSLSEEVLAGPEVWQFVREHMGVEVLEAIAEQRSVTRTFHYHDLARGRITAFRHFDGIGIVVRLHPHEVRTPDQLGLDEKFVEYVRSGKGLILLAGEQGSGLTETMATLLNVAAQERNRYVLVLDDCLEYPVPTGEAIISLRRVGEHTKSYASGLRAALRERPDVIFLGETDPDSFNLSLHAAESGSLVVATVHARSTVSALHRVIRFSPSYDEARVRGMLASLLLGILTVRLVPNSTGTGQVLATEMLRCDEGVREALREGRLSQISLLMSLKDQARGYSMDSSLLRLMEQGEARFEDVFQHAEDKAALLCANQGNEGRN